MRFVRGFERPVGMGRRLELHPTNFPRFCWAVIDSILSKEVLVRRLIVCGELLYRVILFAVDYEADVAGATAPGP